jgi:peptidoglycan/xylan/chitin deacetylase (PgdA/CDA1 family)
MRSITIGYHDIAPGPLESVSRTARFPRSVYTLDRGAFREHLAAIRSSRGRTIGLVGTPGNNGSETPIFLTFDDGYLSSYTIVADELERYNWRGHFFIPTDWIGRAGYMDADQIRELRRRGHLIGSHSCSHPERMSALPMADLLWEWARSCAILESILGEAVNTASVPNGYHSRAVTTAASAAGIRILFTSEPTSAERHDGECRVLGRYALQRRARAATAGAIAAGHIRPRWKQSLWWHAREPVKMLTGDSYFLLRRWLLSRAVH